jgi:hypothetical protein
MSADEPRLQKLTQGLGRSALLAGPSRRRSRRSTVEGGRRAAHRHHRRQRVHEGRIHRRVRRHLAVGHRQIGYGGGGGGGGGTGSAHDSVAGGALASLSRLRACKCSPWRPPPHRCTGVALASSTAASLQCAASSCEKRPPRSSRSLTKQKRPEHGRWASIRCSCSRHARRRSGSVPIRRCASQRDCTLMDEIEPFGIVP